MTKSTQGQTLKTSLHSHSIFFHFTHEVQKSETDTHTHSQMHTYRPQCAAHGVALLPLEQCRYVSQTVFFCREALSWLFYSVIELWETKKKLLWEQNTQGDAGYVKPATTLATCNELYNGKCIGEIIRLLYSTERSEKRLLHIKHSVWERHAVFCFFFCFF